MKIMLDEGAKMPTRAHTCDAGLDLYAAERKVIPARDFVSVETGTHIEIPHGCVGLLTSKSGLMAKHGLTCRGTIDCGYTGSIKAVVFNHSGRDYIIEKGDKVTQLVILPCRLQNLVLVDSLEETDRGDGGFGSTGR
jgi:dUTP pyrophosphatase